MRKPFLIVAVIALAALLAGGFLAMRLLTPRTQGAIATWLVAQFGGQASVGAIRWSLRPGLRITAWDVAVAGNEPGAPPLVDIAEVGIETTFRDLFSAPRRVGLVRLRGLVVRVPPRRRRDSEAREPDRPVQAPAGGAAPRAPSSTAVRVDRVVAEETRIELVSSRPDKPPLVFDVHDLTVEGVAPGQPMTFVARLTNPKPIGEVATRGTLGAWNKQDAGATAIDGTFRFADADLSSLRGLEGILQAEGSYSGSIGEIHATGSADIEHFTVTGRPASLKTRFDVLVGGTSGDVVLKPVDVAVGASQLSASGAVVRARDVKGRRIDMDVAAPAARIEDLLQLAVPSDPAPLSGPTELVTNLRIEPGDAPVIRRLQLDGQFLIRQARFSKTDIQKTLAKLSQFTGGGEVAGEDGSSVAANLGGRFKMADGVLTLTDVSFAVPGTAVRLSGSYGLEGGALDLKGTIRVARSVTEVVPARAGSLLEVLGRIDRRLQFDTSGTTLPIVIGGTREKPIFKVDVTALRGDWRGAVGLGR